HCYVLSQDLHSFPTRRSSDLGELVDHDEDVRHLLRYGKPVFADAARAYGLVIGVDLTLAVLRKVLVPVLHLAHDPPERIGRALRSEEHTSELQSQSNLVCRLL